MTDIPKEAVAAVKLSRADAVKLVAADMIRIAADDVATHEAAVIETRACFRAWAVRIAVNSTDGVIDSAMRVAGSSDRHLSGQCLYQMVEGEDAGDTCDVVLSDSQKSFDSRVRLCVNIPIDSGGLVLRDNWAAALANLKDAKERDLRVGAMSKEARELLIKAALADSPEGLAVVAAVKALSASLKVKT